MPFDEEALHRPDGQGPIDVAAPAGSLAWRRSNIRTHRGDRVGLAGQDVALFESAFSGEVQIAPAVRPDRTGFLTLDVALQPGGVDGLDEEFLGWVDCQAGVPFRGWSGFGAHVMIGRSPTGRIYHRPREGCKARPGLTRTRDRLTLT
jgi:hypothetical protein